MGRARHRRRRWDFEVGVVKGLRNYWVKEEFAHAKARSGWGKGAIMMDMEDPTWVALLVMWGWALLYFLWLVFKKQK